MTETLWEELVLLPVKALSDQELGQLRRSSRSGSGLTSSVVGEQRRRGLLVEGSGFGSERIKKISEMNSQRPITHEIEDLEDFHLSLNRLRDRIDELLSQHGDADIFTNMSFGPHGDDPRIKVFVRE